MNHTMDTEKEIKISSYIFSVPSKIRRHVKINSQILIIPVLIMLIIACHLVLAHKNNKFKLQLLNKNNTIRNDSSDDQDSIKMSLFTNTGGEYSKRKYSEKEIKVKVNLPNKELKESKISEDQTTHKGFLDENKYENQITMVNNSKIKNSEQTPKIDDPMKNLPKVNKRYLRKLEQVGKLPLSKDCTKKFPKSIIIGVMKGGTEAFTTFLAVHPQIAMQFKMRSTLYFTSNYKKGIEWYKQQMPCSTTDQITMEKSPQYLMHFQAPQRIYQFNKNIQLILIVRDPIARAMSHYLQQKSANPHLVKGRTFEQHVLNAQGNINRNCQYIASSTYSKILRHWLQYFKLSQILIIDGDNFKQNPTEELQRTEKFLNLQPYITKDLWVYEEERNIYCLKTCLSSGKGRPHPTIKPQVMLKLIQYFKPYNKQFFNIIGHTFNW